MLILFVQTRKPRGAHISWGRNQEITFGHGGSALSLIEPTDWFVGLKIHFWMSSALHGLLCHGAWCLRGTPPETGQSREESQGQILRGQCGDVVRKGVMHKGERSQGGLGRP